MIVIFTKNDDQSSKMTKNKIQIKNIEGKNFPELLFEWKIDAVRIINYSVSR